MKEQKHLLHPRRQTLSVSHLHPWPHVQWRQWVSPCFQLTYWLLPWRSSLSSSLYPKARPKGAAAPGDHGRPVSKLSLSPLQKSLRWRKKGLHRWRRREPDAPFCSHWRAWEGAHRRCTTRAPHTLAGPAHPRRPAWTPVTQTQPPKEGQKDRDTVRARGGEKREREEMGERKRAVILV